MDFYYLPESSPCRSVMMTAAALGLELNKKLLNLETGDHRQGDFVRVNPQHCVPTLVDGDFVLWESRSILIYLVEKYAKNDNLYPKSAEQQALINQRLYFDMNLYFAFGAYFYPHHRDKKPANAEMLKRLEVQLEHLNGFLEGKLYVACERLTLADIALIASISTFDVVGIDLRKYGNLRRWYENGKKVVPGYKENWEGCKAFKVYYNVP